MRWLILTDDFPPLDGGVATWTDALAGGLHAAGHEVVVFARRRHARRIERPYRVVPVAGPSFGRLGGWWMAAAVWPRLRRGDRVLASTWPMATHLVGRLRALEIPLQVGFHGSDLTRPHDVRALRRVCAAAERRWVMSGFLGHGVRELGFDADRLPVPVDATEGREARAKPERWVFVGRATALKGGDRFVRLATAAGVRGTVIGDGPELERWRAPGPDVAFAGRLRRTEVLGQLSAFDLAFLLPRDQGGEGGEGLGLSLIEAAAAGVATVGCRTGGVPEAVGKGLVLEDPDDVSGSLRAIEQWWTPERGAECQAWVRERCGVGRAVEALLGGG